MSETISVEDFELFSRFFYQHTGIVLDKMRYVFFGKTLTQLFKKSGCSNFQEYLAYLDTTDGYLDLQQIINSLTVNETYFYRESHQLECLVESLLNERLDYYHTLNRFEQNLKIWSMPCATGEEAYSICIFLLEHWYKLVHQDVEVFASDIDSNVLIQAEMGVYQQRSVQGLPEKIRNKYFTRLPNETYRISDDLRDSVRFSRVNLCDPKVMQQYTQFDIIFCRNVLIYFDNESRKKAIQLLYDALAPGGFICLGHAEFMNRFTDMFISRKFAQGYVYQKPFD